LLRAVNNRPYDIYFYVDLSFERGLLKKYEEVTGSASCTSTIYALLKRHGWRKLKPRTENPGKASEEEIAASKKLTKNTKGYYWQTSGTSTKSTITCG